MSVSADYAKAMIAGDINKALRIENTYDLLGYPPEIVSVGLKAVDNGEDVHAAVDRYINGQDTQP